MKPLKFRPVYKTPLWGGQDLVALKGASDYETIGESWEISAVPGDETPVTEGAHAGATLPQLIDQLGADLVGKANFARYGNAFPLLIKWISAREPLSIQVHPNDEMAQRVEGKPYGKTEMWFIVQSHADADLYMGFQRDLTPDEYVDLMQRDELLPALNHVRTQPGDSYFIPAGQIHSIGQGNLIIEIQQASDLTYRVYDFNRKDAEGNTRELHTDKAKAALSFAAKADHRSDYVPTLNQRVTLEQHPEFTTNQFRCDAPTKADFAAIDSFVIFIAYEGSATLVDNEGHATTLRAGESILFPATTQWVDIQPQYGSTFACLETYVV